MSDEQQPRAQWIFSEQKKSNKRRTWLIVGLSVLVVAIIGIVLLIVIPRNDEAAPHTSESTPPPTPSMTSTTEPEPDPSLTPMTTPPPAPDPDLSTFTIQVQPRLDDAVRGLNLLADNMDVGAQIIDSLQQDAEVLSDSMAPRSISDDWSAKVGEYSGRLGELRSTIDGGDGSYSALNAATVSLHELRLLVGL